MKWKKIILKTSIGLMILGGITLALGVVTGGKEYIANADLNDLALKDKTSDSSNLMLTMEPLNDFNQIMMDIDFANIEILPSEDNQSYLSYQIVNENHPQSLEYQVDKDTLRITKKRNQWDAYIDISFVSHLFSSETTKKVDETKITLYLSKDKELSELTLAIIKGDLRIQQLNSLSTDIYLEMGDLEINNSHLNQAKVVSDLGNITGSQLMISGNSLFESEMGDIQLELLPKTLKTTQFSLQTELGTLQIPNLSGDLTEHTFDSTQEFPNTLRITSELGDIILR